LVVEREDKLWLRRVVMSHDKQLGEEELKGEDLFSFEKPGEPIDHAVFVGGKLYLKSEEQILVANEGVVELPKGLKLKTNLVYSNHSIMGGLRCLGELEGVMQEVSILNKQVTPDPNASGIAFYFNTVTKVYPAVVHPVSEKQGWFSKKPTSTLSNGLHSCAFGFNDLFQDGF